MIIPDTIKQRLISELKLEEYSQDTQQQVIDGMTTVIMQRALVEFTAVLPEEKHEELVTLSTAEETEALRTFLTQNIPNFEDIVRDAAADEIRIFLKAKENDFKE